MIVIHQLLIPFEILLGVIIVTFYYLYKYQVNRFDKLVDKLEQMCDKDDNGPG